VSISASQLLLLDTSVVIHLARNDKTGQRIESDLSLTARTEKPLISTVVEGELLGFAKYRGWGDKRRNQLLKLLKEFVRIEAGLREIVDAYAEIYADGQRSGNPCGRQQNDLWIAATAKATNAVLLTCDKDFDWMHNRHITRHYFDCLIWVDSTQVFMY